MATRRGWWQGTQGDRVEVQPPTEMVERTLNSRPERIARSEARRAARRGAAAPPTILVARPAGSGTVARSAAELADARMYTSARIDELARVLEEGRSDEATHIVEDLLRTEQAIWILVDHTEVPPQWQHLADELTSASDRIMEALRALQRSPEGVSTLGTVRAGLSDWVRAWRSFVLIIASER